jgi:chromosome segregation ATPase
METVTVLVALAVVAAVAAFYFWNALAKVQSQLDGLRQRADKAEAEAGKHQERADQLKRKLETARADTSKDDREADKHKARATEAKEEVKRLTAQIKRLEDEGHARQTKLHKLEAHVEELTHMLHDKQKRKPTQQVPAAEPAPPPRSPDDERFAARRAELEAEKAARIADAEKAKAEREAQRAARRDDVTEKFIEKLKAERVHLSKMVFDRELELRIVRRKAEDNRRAWVMTMGALDLAEDEVYRLKHGRERPQFEPTRADPHARPHDVGGADGQDAEAADALDADQGADPGASADQPGVMEPDNALADQPATSA